MEDRNKIEKEFDPELALMAQNAKMELEANQENNDDDNGIDVHEEEIMVEEEAMGEEGENSILRGKKKKKNYNNYSNYNNNNNKYYNNNNNNKDNYFDKANAKTPLKKKVIQKKELIYDPNFDYESNYFYQTISKNEWDEIKSFLIKCFQNQSQIPSESYLQNFFISHPKLKKGNIENLQALLDSISSQYKNFQVYQKIIQYFIKEYYKPKPSICNVYFFPNAKNEKYLIEMLRTCKQSLNVAIFSLTRDNFAKSLIEVFKRGVKVRVIADDECVKNYGSDIYTLAANGIPCKTDNSAQFHMHNKYAIIDESVIVTGSFNWTTQAINNNQENLLFYEDKDLAKQYLSEFDKLWKEFTTTIDKQTAIKKIEEEKKNAKK